VLLSYNDHTATQGHPDEPSTVVMENKLNSSNIRIKAKYSLTYLKSGGKKQYLHG